MVQCSAALALRELGDRMTANRTTWRDRAGAPSSDAPQRPRHDCSSRWDAQSSIVGWGYQVDTRGSHRGREVTGQGLTGPSLRAGSVGILQKRGRRCQGGELTLIDDATAGGALGLQL